MRLGACKGSTSCVGTLFVALRSRGWVDLAANTLGGGSVCLAALVSEPGARLAADFFNAASAIAVAPREVLIFPSELLSGKVARAASLCFLIPPCRRVKMLLRLRGACGAEAVCCFMLVLVSKGIFPRTVAFVFGLRLSSSGSEYVSSSSANFLASGSSQLNITSVSSGRSVVLRAISQSIISKNLPE